MERYSRFQLIVWLSRLQLYYFHSLSLLLFCRFCGHGRQLFSAKLPKSPLYATYNRLKGQIFPCGVSGDKARLKESNSWIYIHQVVREEKTNHIMIMLLNESQQKN